MTKKAKQNPPAGNRNAVHSRSQGLIGVFVITFISGLVGLTVLGGIFIFFLESEQPNSVTSLIPRQTITGQSPGLNGPISQGEPGMGQSGGSSFGYGIESVLPHTNDMPNEGAALKAEVQDHPSSPAIGQATQVGSTALARYSQGALSISGRVLSNSGEPLPQLQLSARRTHLGSPRSTAIERDAYTQSMAGGHYQFAGLEEGEYIIALADGAYPSVKVFARTGSIDANLVVPEINRSLTLYGSIQDQRGEPVPGSLVMLAGGNTLSARSDANGKYKIKFVLDRDRASYELRIQHDAYEPIIMEITDQHLSRVGDQLQVDVTLQALQAVTTINGQVRNTSGAPLQGETVWFHSPKLEQYYSAITDATGRFVISRVESSTDYRLQVRPREPFRDYTRENVRLSGEVATVDIVLETGTTGTVSGKIVAPDGNPMPGFNLWLRSVDRVSQIVELRTDNIGNFMINDAPSGDLLFYTRSAPQIQISGVYLPPDKTQNVNLVVDWGNYEFEGRVLDFASNPVPGATLLLTWFQQKNGIRSRSIRKAITDRDGLFRFTQLALGQRTLRVEAPRYKPVQVEHKMGRAPGPIELRLDGN